MAGESKTIDNLGLDLSVKYAQNEQLYDDSLIKESNIIPKLTQLSVIVPHVSSEIDELFDYDNKNQTWADFVPPPNYVYAKTNLFSHNIAPSLGPIEIQEEEKEKINKLQTQNLSANDEKEIDALLNFFDIFEKLNQDLSSINSKRSQYHKG